MYQVGREYTGPIEKKNAIGIWSKRHMLINSTKLSIADNESAAPSFHMEMQSVTRTEDPLVFCVTAMPGGPDASVNLRGDSRKTADYWFDLLRMALEAAGRMKPRNCGLPDVDPRHGLAFYEIPPSHAVKFRDLQNSVLYWFSPVRKFGAKSKLLANRHVTEDRVVFITDKCVFVTKPDAEVTRCFKIDMIASIHTNTEVREKQTDDVFVIVKMKAPEFDLYFSAPDAATSITVLTTLYKYITRSGALPVEQVAASDKVPMQLSRQSDFQMKIIVPTSKSALKTALDNFARKHGVTFSSTGRVGRAKAIGADGTSPAPSTAAASPDSARDPLLLFLRAVGQEALFKSLVKQEVDLDVLEAMEEEDYSNFGIKDRAVVAAIRDKLTDSDFVDACRSGGLPASVAASPQQASPSPATGGRVVIDLSDDDDLLSPTNTSRPPIVFDDSDDDLLAGTVSTAPKMAISLDSDDDLLGSGPAAKPAVSGAILDDDDI